MGIPSYSISSSKFNRWTREHIGHVEGKADACAEFPFIKQNISKTINVRMSSVSMYINIKKHAIVNCNSNLTKKCTKTLNSVTTGAQNLGA